MAKKILKEATIRRFQKLANVAPINEMYTQESYHMKEEDEAGADLDAPEGEEMDDMPKADADMGAEEDAMVELTMDKIETLEQASAIIDDIVSSAGGADGEGMDDMGDMDMADDEVGAEDDAADAIMEALRGISYVPSQSEIVNEVAQRVARRLQAAKLHEAKLNRALGRRK